VIAISDISESPRYCLIIDGNQNWLLIDNDGERISIIIVRWCFFFFGCDSVHSDS
jgi:hypothetical protein